MLTADSSVSPLIGQPLPPTIRNNLLGQRFDRLIVEAYAYTNTDRKSCWHCRCDCGNACIVIGASLCNGNTASCGCLRRDVMHAIGKKAQGRTHEDLTGQRFVHLLVIEMRRGAQVWYAQCRCDCGTITLVRSKHLKKGARKSCGCLRYRTDEEKHASRRRRDHAYRSRRGQAPYDFTRDDELFMRDYWKNSCAICGSPADFWRTIAWDHWIPLLDPQTPGTVSGNIVPLCQAKKGAASVPGPRACNNSKWAKDPVAWITQRLGPRKAPAKLRDIEAYFAVVRQSA